MPKFKQKFNKNQSGQTLIETIAAIGILVTTLTAGLALAIYVLGNAGVNQNEIVATNLAREGVEVVRMIRDTNWLADDASSDATYNLQVCADVSNSFCYPKVRVLETTTSTSQSSDLIDSSNMQLVFNEANSAWQLKGGGNDFTLNQDLNSPSTNKYYGMFGAGSTISDYTRKIQISSNTVSPYSNTGANNNSNAEMIVKVTVGWMNTKHCPKSGAKNDPTSNSWPRNCKVTVEEHLTNWKDYR